MRKPIWLVLGALLLAGCGTAQQADGVASISGGPTSSSSAAPDDGGRDEDKVREFAKCMRENGVDMPDPEVDGKGGIAIRIDGGDAGMEEMKKAEEACKQFLPNGGEMRKPTPEEMDRMREEIKCLREKGIDVPEPDFENGGGIGLPFDDDTDKTQKAMEECGFGGQVSRADG
ncbi:hypothetical protein [Saccharothrix sp.]|uniref:hypothetical protein n=1 Tax=Saccharothrix sp. TaxID=1873460 RepID=UPI0028122A8A|nr:hypothetical protein [Saccharothrix sp.]